MGNSDAPPAISGVARCNSAGNDAACRESRASARAAVGRARLIARGSDDVLKITSDLAT